MNLRKRLYVAGLLLSLTATVGVAQVNQDPVNKQVGAISFTEPKERDPLLQHAKETYVLFGCAYCHGVDLKSRNGEATDLMHSQMVGRDDNGNLLGKLLRAGIPQTPKLSPMPQFADLSDKELDEIVLWIHYARQQGRYKDLMEDKAEAGSSAAGKSFFESSCVSCHSRTDMSNVVKKYGTANLKQHLIRPDFLIAVRSFKVEQLGNEKMTAARKRHGALLENYTAQDVANLLAFLQAPN
jgi:mono/diheme cytochrome c family protein